MSDAAVANAETTIKTAAKQLRELDLTPSPGAKRRRCEVRMVCAAAKG